MCVRVCVHVCVCMCVCVCVILGLVYVHMGRGQGVLKCIHLHTMMRGRGYVLSPKTCQVNHFLALKLWHVNSGCV